MELNINGWWERSLTQRETVNTVSSLAYLVPAALGGDLQWACLMAALALASALYHATANSWARRLDQSAMYAVFAYLAALALGYTGALALVIAGVVAAALWPSAEIDLGTRIGIMLAVALSHAHTWLLTLALFSLAMLSWQLDQHRLLTGRWGHAVWHVLSAAGLYALRGGLP
jgi:hypothetical protein